MFQNGVLLRTVLDPVTGDLSDTRTRYLGSRPVKLFRVRMQGQEAVRPSYFCIIFCSSSIRTQEAAAIDYLTNPV